MASKNKTPTLTRASFVFSRSFFSKLIPFLLRFLIFVILVGFFGGTIKTLFDLRSLLFVNVEEALRQLLLNVMNLLAVIEVIKTALSYLSDGRVRVTYIVDTVLIVMLNEVISLWFKGTTLIPVITLMIILLTLIIVRILAIRFSPDGD